MAMQKLRQSFAELSVCQFLQFLQFLLSLSFLCGSRDEAANHGSCRGVNIGGLIDPARVSGLGAGLCLQSEMQELVIFLILENLNLHPAVLLRGRWRSLARTGRLPRVACHLKPPFPIVSGPIARNRPPRPVVWVPVPPVRCVSSRSRSLGRLGVMAVGVGSWGWRSWSG